MTYPNMDYDLLVYPELLAYYDAAALVSIVRLTDENIPIKRIHRLNYRGTLLCICITFAVKMI